MIPKNHKYPSAARVKELFNYDAETGVFTRRVTARKRNAGDAAGNLRADGYLVISVDGISCMAHRLAWQFVTGELPEKQIDHLDCNRANNRFANLRDVDNATNIHNQRSARVTNKTSGLLGVSFVKQRGKYRACLEIKGKSLHLGMFDDPLEAHAAYIQAKRRLHPGCTL